MKGVIEVIPQNCTHPSCESLIELEGLVVRQCIDCNDILPLDKEDAEDTIYSHTTIHLGRAQVEMEKSMKAIDEYLNTHLPLNKYEVWYEVSQKLPWWFCIMKDKYLVLNFRDVSKQRLGALREQRQKKNISTTRSFGRIEKYEDLEKLFYYCDMYFAWKKIVKFLEEIQKAVEGNYDSI